MAATVSWNAGERTTSGRSSTRRITAQPSALARTRYFPGPGRTTEYFPSVSPRVVLSVHSPEAAARYTTPVLALATALLAVSISACGESSETAFEHPPNHADRQLLERHAHDGQGHEQGDQHTRHRELAEVAGHESGWPRAARTAARSG